MSIVQGLGVGCSMMPLATWGEPGRGVKPSQVVAGAPPGAAVETAKMAAQHKRTESILSQKLERSANVLFTIEPINSATVVLEIRLLFV